jgi:glycerol-3-phosphate dehydrogenase (NAD(P)+)
LKISVLGCGRWGSFIAWYLNKIGHDVTLWGLPGSPHIAQIINFGKNEFLTIDEKITVTDDLGQAVNSSEIMIISISAQALRKFAGELAAYKSELGKKTIILCMKGIEESTGKRLSEVVKDCLGEDMNVAVWVGPGHVQDFIKGIPNCMVIDCENERTKKFLVSEFSSPLIRFYYGTDVIGNEVGAAAKNVIAIAAGALDGMNFESLKGALMSRGAREISCLIKAMGGNDLSAYGLAHLGDYQATLFSEHSNNRKFGELFVKHKHYDKLAEGVSTSHAIIKLSEKYGVDMPICHAVHNVVLDKMSPEQAIKNLFNRESVAEF